MCKHVRLKKSNSIISGNSDNDTNHILPGDLVLYCPSIRQSGICFLRLTQARVESATENINYLTH